MWRTQIFTRLTQQQVEALHEIGAELAAKGAPVTKPSGELNLSAVIRVLLGKADKRLKEDRA